MEKNKIISRTLHTATDLRIREAGEGEAPSRVITGYAILFDVPSAPLYSDEAEEIREIISAEAVTQELLDASDIKMTMFHDRQLILARSKNGEGTLSYHIDEKGVYFEFEAPNTVDGEKALELVRRGDIAGCSFAFTTYYFDDAYVSRSVVRSDGKSHTTYTVRMMTGIYDFTLAADPAYPDTHCEARELVSASREKPEPTNEYREQVRAMRSAASRAIV